MVIECENCQGTEYQVQDGATFCVNCGKPLLAFFIHFYPNFLLIKV